MDQDSPSSLRVSLDHAMRVGPQQTTVVNEKIGELVDKVQDKGGIIVPAGELALRNCDFMETVWSEQEKFTVTLTNL